MRRITSALMWTLLLFLGLGIFFFVLDVLIKAAKNMTTESWGVLIGFLIFSFFFGVIYVLTPGDTRKKKEKLKNESNHS